MTGARAQVRRRQQRLRRLRDLTRRGLTLHRRLPGQILRARLLGVLEPGPKGTGERGGAPGDRGQAGEQRGGRRPRRVRLVPRQRERGQAEVRARPHQKLYNN